MPIPAVHLQNIPQFEFDGDGVYFDPDDCDHGSIPADTLAALSSDLIVNGDSEDHILPPHAILPETFSSDLLEAELRGSKTSALEIAANPKYEGPPCKDVKKMSEEIHLDLRQELIRLRSDPKAYMRRVREISNKIYYVPSHSVLPSNHKMVKGLKHGWRTEGVTLAPNVIAGLGDICPFSSPLCTANCLNLSGHSEISGGLDSDVMDCRRRRTLMFTHMPEAFQARVAELVEKRNSETPGRYSVRLNVTSDLVWEKIRFFSPWTREHVTLPELFPDIQFYDYTKNCKRYLDWLSGKLPSNYHLTFSLSEINALFAFYALRRGGSVTVIFDAPPEHTGGDAHVRYPADPLPDSFCGFPVVDGDETDLRFEDRKRFGVPEGQGFVVGLRLKGKKHRREYKLDKASLAGFVFDAKREYDPAYAEELIDASENRRTMALKARERRDLPGVWKQRFVGIPEALASEARKALGLGCL